MATQERAASLLRSIDVGVSARGMLVLVIHRRLVLPPGLTARGLPVGIEFDAPARSDRKLLALGLSLEHALGPIPPPNI
jgi:hypothetical protein